MTLLDILKHLVGDGFTHLGPPLDGQAFDVSKLHLPVGDLLLEKLFEQPPGLLGDVRADAVAADDADDNRRDGGEIEPVRGLLNPIHTRKLKLQKPSEMLLCPLDYVNAHSSPSVLGDTIA